MSADQRERSKQIYSGILFSKPEPSVLVHYDESVSLRLSFDFSLHYCSVKYPDSAVKELAVAKVKLYYQEIGEENFGK